MKKLIKAISVILATALIFTSTAFASEDVTEGETDESTLDFSVPEYVNVTIRDGYPSEFSIDGYIVQNNNNDYKITSLSVVIEDENSLFTLVPNGSDFSSFSVDEDKYSLISDEHDFYDGGELTIDNISLEKDDFIEVPLEGQITSVSRTISDASLVKFVATVSADKTVIEKVPLSSLTWAEIAEISESGLADKYFELGDTKTFSYLERGQKEKATVRIIGFNHDVSAETGEKVGITFLTTEPLFNDRYDTFYEELEMMPTSWGQTRLRTTFIDFENQIVDQDLIAAIKPVVKRQTVYYQPQDVIETTIETLWTPSYSEFLGDVIPEDMYEWFAEDPSRAIRSYEDKIITHVVIKYEKTGTRSGYHVELKPFENNCEFKIIETGDVPYRMNYSTGRSDFFVGFCI